MNEMLRSLGFGQVTNTKWTNGSAMMILVSSDYLTCVGDVGNSASIDYVVTLSGIETMKHHVEKFMRMVGKCIQVDEE